MNCTCKCDDGSPLAFCLGTCSKVVKDMLGKTEDYEGLVQFILCKVQDLIEDKMTELRLKSHKRYRESLEDGIQIGIRVSKEFYKDEF